MNVLVFGSCNLDYIYRVERIVSGGETLPIEGVQVSPGGKGLNQAVALARAGLCVRFAGCVGADGDGLRQLLRENGVDVSMLRTVEDRTGQAHIQVTDEGENAILLYPGANRRVTKEQIDEALSQCEAGDLLVLQNEISELPYLIERGSALGLRIVLNPSPFEPALTELDLSRVDLMFLNETEAAGFAGERSLADFISDTRKSRPGLRCVVTLGAAGSLYFDKDVWIKQAALPAEAVDTTCAGDTFTGYFTEALLKTGDPAEALLRASAASAVVIGRVGAAGCIPEKAEVDARLRAQGHIAATN